MSDLISIVVPVYNVESYLEKCIDSILNQSYSNFELILVNDGSTDNSGKICSDFEKKDSRIKVINKDNGGLSDARNHGIDIASGRYITFIDSDDFVEVDYIFYLYNLLKKYGTKISICAYNILLENGEKINLGKGFEETLMSKEDSFKRMLNEEGFSVSAWAKMYDLELFTGVRYPFGKLCEDNGTTYKLIDKVDKVAYGNIPKYNYLKRNGSIMLSDFNLRKLDMIDLTDVMCDYLESKYPALNDVILRRRVYSRFNILRQLDGKSETKQIEQEIKHFILSYKKEIFFKNAFSLRDKLATFFLLFGKKTFDFAWKMYSKVVYNS
ncbi:glycosyltransferase [Streptococcus ruminicola]|jgi:glycosyltransferase involved in cell wall biosynthesis|uniref:Glycosyltransferase n=1 Tax=Streptococcus ruminicola TaxID=2686210 RepID=A0AAE6R3K9_9STRE|nr:glycosyltransferase family 2 protein [Streptococcus ruminicola]QGZ27068.1 glycosyltransferase [Streptococcus ruminicola]